MAKVLYLSYDGISDPLGQSQILPYLRELVRLGHEIHLVSFEKPARFEPARDEWVATVAAAGVHWHPLPYTKRPPVLSTMWDVWRLSALVRRLHRQHGFDLVHCRSYVTALAGLRLKRREHVRFVFDMRGFWPDEKVEGGTWNLRNPLFGRVYRFFKAREAEFVSEADGMVTLTNAGRRIIERWGAWVRHRPPIAVIPCAADFAAFEPPTPAARAAARAELGIADEKALVVAYLGSLGTWYMLNEMLDWFAVLVSRRPSARLLMITPDDPAEVRGAAAARGIAAGAVSVVSAARSRVPFYLSAADVGLFFIRPTYSKQGSSPTKLGELLAMGIPIVTNAGVGDVDETIEALGAGIVVSEFSTAAYARSVDGLDALAGIDRSSLRARARQLLDLPSGVAAYHDLYAAVLQ